MRKYDLKSSIKRNLYKGQELLYGVLVTSKKEG
jgi:hypothetical protein